MFASSFIVLNVIQLYKDKQVRGVSLISLSFFSVWGSWQIYYFWNIDQFWSLAGTVALAMTNIIWATMAIYYSRINKQ
jgi:hypothetical protein